MKQKKKYYITRLGFRAIQKELEKKTKSIQQILMLDKSFFDVKYQEILHLGHRYNFFLRNLNNAYCQDKKNISMSLLNRMIYQSIQKQLPLKKQKTPLVL